MQWYQFDGMEKYIGVGKIQITKLCLPLTRHVTSNSILPTFSFFFHNMSVMISISQGQNLEKMSTKWRGDTAE